MNKEEIKFKLQIGCLIRNIISLICFTILAIIFGHWWIVLFSALFTSWVKEGGSNE
jgi:hypothetical protein